MRNRQLGHQFRPSKTASQSLNREIIIMMNILLVSIKIDHAKFALARIIYIIRRKL